MLGCCNRASSPQFLLLTTRVALHGMRSTYRSKSSWSCERCAACNNRRQQEEGNSQGLDASIPATAVLTLLCASQQGNAPCHASISKLVSVAGQAHAKLMSHITMHGPSQVFDLMDRDKGGSLGVDEVKQLMDMLGKSGSRLGGLWKRFSKWTYWVS